MFDPDDENPLPSWTPPQESSLEDTQVRPDAEQVPGFSEITYQLVQEGTIRGKTKLVSNTAYSYNVRKRRPNGTIDWQCTVRRKDFRCMLQARLFTHWDEFSNNEISALRLPKLWSYMNG